MALARTLAKIVPLLRSLLTFVFGFGALITHEGCSSRACTLVSCDDGANVTIKTRDGTWLPGKYTLTLSTDRTIVTCEASFPEGLVGPNGTLGSLACDDAAVVVTVFPETICQTIPNGTSCTPVPDHFEIRTRLAGTPPSIDVAVERDDRELMHANQRLHYEEAAPNGRECGPICRGASAAFTLTEP